MAGVLLGLLVLRREQPGHEDEGDPDPDQDLRSGQVAEYADAETDQHQRDDWLRRALQRGDGQKDGHLP